MKITILFLVAALVIATGAVVNLVRKKMMAMRSFSATAHLLAKQSMLPTNAYDGMRW